MVEQNKEINRYFLTLLDQKNDTFVSKLDKYASEKHVKVRHFNDRDSLEKFLGDHRSSVTQIVLYTNSHHSKWLSNLNLSDETYLHLVLESDSELDLNELDTGRIQSVLTIPKKATETIDFSEIYQNFNYDPTMGVSYYIGQPEEEFVKEILNSKNKDEVIEQLEQTILNKVDEKNQRAFEDHAKAATELLDELILNAVYNANPRFKEADRSQDFELKGDEAIKVCWGIASDKLAIAVTDPFGALEKSDTLKFALNSVTTKLQDKTSGGRGLRVVYERANSMIINRLPGVKTEIICVLKLSNRLSRFKPKIRSLIFQSA